MFRLAHHLTAAVVGVLMLAQSIVMPAAAPKQPAVPAPKATVVAMVATDAAVNAAPAAKGKLIYIDPGHGGSDPGAVHKADGGQVDVAEEDANLAISLKLADMLRADGYDVQLTRTSDSEVVPGSKAADLQKRVDMANEAGADLLISVHHNAAGNESARGTEVWYCGD
ncbi:MAG: N-acetylmuramoyl-L-alanine amidase, partial [Anaerolineae bacterium]|nr:N-acetylmuramoyl-L-alanine amidase [Anaerolineae bacterium]